jgi:uncharacterized protein (PEP-CTERM system associated)
LGISITHYKDAYVQPSTQDDTRDLLEAHVSRQLTPTLQVALSQKFYYQKFNDLAASTTELYTDAHLTWRLGRYLHLTFDFNHSSRHSDFAGSDYTENRLWLMLGYGRPAEVPPGPPRPRLPSQSPY